MVGSPPSTRRRLLERADCVDALRRVCKRIDHGEGAVLFISGEAGFGKTSLLDETRRLAPAQARVFRGRGSAMEADLPFGLVTQVLEPLAGRSLTEAGNADASGARSAVLVRCREWVETAAAEAPLLLLVDDLHWSDPDSLAVLPLLCRLVAGRGVGLVAALRPWPPAAADLARSLVAEGVAELSTLAPLSRPAADEMLTGLLRQPPSGPLSAAAWTFSRGNPYLIEQSAGMVQSRGQLPEATGEGGRLHAVLPLSRLEALPGPAISCAQAAAVLGVELRVAHVAAVADLSDDEAAEGLDGLVAAGVLRETRPGWAEFTHALLCQALYDDLLPARRATLHARAFARLAALEAVSAAAPHAIAADLIGDVEAVAVVEAAGRLALERGGVLTAIELLRAAESLAGTEASAQLRITLGDALLAAGRPAEAAQSLRAVLTDGAIDAVTRLRACRGLVLALAYSGDLAASGELGAEALDLARLHVPDAVSGLLVDRVHALWQLEGPRGALQLLDDVGHETALPVDPGFQAAWLFITFCGTGDPSVLPELSRLATDPAGTLLAPFEPLLVYSCVARWCEDFDEDDRVLELARTRATKQGTLRASLALTLSLCNNRVLQGRLPEALALLEVVERDLPIEPLMAPAVAAAHADVLCQLGHFDQAAARLHIGAPGAVMWQIDLTLRAVQGRLHLEQGRVDEACEAYLAVEQLVEHLGISSPLVYPWASGAIAAYEAANRRADVVRVCQWLESRSASTPTWAEMVALSGRAGVAAGDGDRPTADRLYKRAAAIASPLTLDRAAVLVRYGEWLRATGRPSEARRPLAQAVTMAEEVGASPLATRAGAGLRAAGGRRSRRTSDPEELTDQERRVAALAADGLTTIEIAGRLYLSPKTIETHLGRVYAKLGITSRRALRGRSLGS